MNALVIPEAATAAQPDDHPSSTPGAQDVQRHVWQGAFGQMLIEVRDGVAFVNGERVLPLADLRDAGPG